MEILLPLVVNLMPPHPIEFLMSIIILLLGLRFSYFKISHENILSFKGLITLNYRKNSFLVFPVDPRLWPESLFSTILY